LGRFRAGPTRGSDYRRSEWIGVDWGGLVNVK
jgi:hypothetical protein